MLEIHHIERTHYRRLGGLTYGDSTPVRNNAQMKQIWEHLTHLSNGALPDFDDLYWFGGAAHPAYDIEGRLGNTPPTMKIIVNGQELETLLPVYKSMIWRDRIRPAVLGVWARLVQPELAGPLLLLLNPPNTNLLR